MISVYAMCGYAGFTTVGVSLGVLRAIAPNRAGRLANIRPGCQFSSPYLFWQKIQEPLTHGENMLGVVRVKQHILSVYILHSEKCR